MSIAIRQTTLAKRRARVFRGIGEKMYGRLERASATGSPFSGSAATSRSYLGNHLDHLVGPVIERVVAGDGATTAASDADRAAGSRGVATSSSGSSAKNGASAAFVVTTVRAQAAAS